MNENLKNQIVQEWRAQFLTPSGFIRAATKGSYGFTRDKHISFLLTALDRTTEEARKETREEDIKVLEKMIVACPCDDGDCDRCVALQQAYEAYDSLQGRTPSEGETQKI